MRNILILIFILRFELVFGQDFSYPILNQESQSISELIPKDWTLLDSVSGDLNMDNFKDYVIVFQFIDSVLLINEYNDTLITQPRILGIFFGDISQNKYSLIEQSNSFILNHDNPYMDDPFNGIRIEKNILSIGFRIWYSWGSWWTSESTYKFRYENNDFTLIGFDSWSMHRASMETMIYSVNFLTKKYSITQEETIEEEIKSKTEWKSFKIDKLKTLNTLKKPFNWSFENEISI
jgi:hypothetical protein